MQQYLPYLLVLACPVGMGLMMWFRTRGKHSQDSAPPSAAQQEAIAMLRAEIDALHEQQQNSHNTPGCNPPSRRSRGRHRQPGVAA